MIWIHVIGGACSEAPDTRMRIAGGAPGLTALGELGSTSLGELARKLQARLVRILGRRHERMLWGSVENSLRRKAAVRVQLYGPTNWD